jgi:hypothetical protein
VNTQPSKKKSAFDLNDPFFKPLWLRVLIVAGSIGWGMVEFASGAAFWGTLFCAIGAYAFYGFFIAFEPREPEDATKTKDESSE